MNTEMNIQARSATLGGLACLVSLAVCPAGKAWGQGAANPSKSAGSPVEPSETLRGRQIAFQGEALAQSRAPATETTLDLARSQFLGRDFDQAIASYSRAIQQDSQNPLAWLGRAIARFKRDAEAIRTCTGDACKGLKRPIEDDYLTARQLDPNVLDAYRRWAGTGAEKETKEFKESVVVQWAAVYNVAGQAAMTGEKYAEALSNFNRAIELQPDYSLHYVFRGMLYQCCLKQPDRALDDFNLVERRYQERPNDPDRGGAYYGALFQRAKVFRDTGDFSQAIADLNKILGMSPANSAALLQRGMTYEQLGQSDRALADFNESIRLSPDGWEAYYERGALQIERKEYAKALLDLDEAIRLNPKHAESRYCRGLVYVEQNKLRQAIEEFTDAIRLAPKFPAAYFHRGRTRLKVEDVDGAIADFTQVIAFAETIRIVPAELALVYEQRGDAYAKQGEAA